MITNKLKVLFGIVLFSLAGYIQADPIRLAVIEVKDGDTFSISVLLPSPLNDLDVRIIGIDTPEMPAVSYTETGKLNKAGCVQEAELALKSTAYVKQMIANNGGVVELRNYKWDKYGGRINAEAYVGAINLGPHLISMGYAVPYSGAGPRHNWCL